jgi:hypothetical protein
VNVIVDNSAGGDPRLAGDLARRLRAQGLEVEVRDPTRSAMFDTSVHLVSTGIVIRVAERPEPALLRVIEQVVRAALLEHPSPRRRTRSVPLQLGEGSRVLEWIDVFP